VVSYRSTIVLILLGCVACAPDTPKQRKAKMTSLVRDAEKSCGLPTGSVRVLAIGKDYFMVDSGCPTTPIHRCLWNYKTAHGLTAEQFPAILPLTCRRNGVE